MAGLVSIDTTSNAVQANLLSACASEKESLNQDYNVAVSERTALNELFELIRDSVYKISPGVN